MPLALSKPTPSPDENPSFEPGRKLGLVALAQLWRLLDEDPQCPSRIILDKMAQRQIGASVNVRHLNRLRAQVEMQSAQGPSSSPGPEPTRARPRCAHPAHASCGSGGRPSVGSLDRTNRTAGGRW